MAKKVDEKKVVKVKPDIRQKIIVAEGRNPLFGEEIPFKVVYQEFVKNSNEAKERVKQLKNEYPNNSVSYFSV